MNSVIYVYIFKFYNVRNIQYKGVYEEENNGEALLENLEEKDKISNIN